MARITNVEVELYKEGVVSGPKSAVILSIGSCVIFYQTQRSIVKLYGVVEDFGVDNSQINVCITELATPDSFGDDVAALCNPDHELILTEDQYTIHVSRIASLIRIYDKESFVIRFEKAAAYAPAGVVFFCEKTRDRDGNIDTPEQPVISQSSPDPVLQQAVSHGVLDDPLAIFE